MSLADDEALALGDLDAHDQAALVARGDLSARELAQAALTRIRLVDGPVNAVTWTADPDRLRDPPGGALAGVPLLLKASLAYPGWPATSCSRARAGATGGASFPFVDALEAGGLVPVGMTAMPEFGLLTGGEPMLTGPVNNPWSPAHSAGGSSTGAAAAVAAGLVPLAHASDAAGSIRIPAACCGVLGLKASRAANLRARAPHLIDDLLCSDGLIARSSRDLAWGFETTRDPAAPILSAAPVPGLKIAVCLRALDDGEPDAAVGAAVTRAADACADLGCTVEILRGLPVDGPSVVRAFQTIWLHEGGEIVDLVAAARPGIPLDRLLEPWTLGLAEARTRLPLEATGAAFALVEASRIRLAALFGRYDLLLSPVAATPPPPLGAFDPAQPFERLWETFWRYTGYTPLANLAGVPSLTVPIGSAADLPIGVMLTAAPARDRTLLALAAALEEAMRWRDRWPAQSAHARAAARGGPAAGA